MYLVTMLQLSVVMLNVVMLSVVMLNVVKMSVVMLNNVMLSVVRLNVMMLNVVVPRGLHYKTFYCRNKIPYCSKPVSLLLSVTNVLRQ